MANNSTEFCFLHGEEESMHPVVVTCVMLTYLASVLTFLAFGKYANDVVDTQHPVFALVFQEILVLGVAQSLCMISYMLKVTLQTKQMDVVSIGVVASFSSFSLQFHQNSWLCITFLRYYLLIITYSAEDINLSRLRCHSILAVWVATILCLILSHLPFIIILVRDFPIIDQMDPYTQFMVMASTFIISNMPDIFSILLCIKMWHHFKGQVGPLEGKVEIAQVAVEMRDTDYGGIWVGGGESLPEMALGAEIPKIVITSPEEEGSTTATAIQSLCPPDNIVLEIPEEQESNVNSASAASHKVKSVMGVLRTHSLLALADLLAIVAMPLTCLRFGFIIGYVILFVFSFWVPLFVVNTSFKQLGSMRKYWKDKLFC